MGKMPINIPNEEESILLLANELQASIKEWQLDPQGKLNQPYEKAMVRITLNGNNYDFMPNGILLDALLDFTQQVAAGNDYKEIIKE